MTETSSCGWHGLRSDPLPWLLDEQRPNLLWRVLTDLVARPVSSPAVRRAQGRANVVEPVSTLLGALHPDGSWATDEGPWSRYGGPGWRLLAAVQLGADPSDPRLQAAAGRLLEAGTGDGGFSESEDRTPDSLLTARVLEALAALGWCRHLAFQEAMSWLEEVEWTGSPETVAVAVLGALARCQGQPRPGLLQRAVEEVLSHLGQEEDGGAVTDLGFPNLERTDAAELLFKLHLAGQSFEPRMGRALEGLQQAQTDGGRWRRGAALPPGFPLAPGSASAVGCESAWISLEAVVAVYHYGVDAGLPRLFPQKTEP